MTVERELRNAIEAYTGRRVTALRFVGDQRPVDRSFDRQYGVRAAVAGIPGDFDAIIQVRTGADDWALEEVEFATFPPQYR